MNTNLKVPVQNSEVSGVQVKDSQRNDDAEHQDVNKAEFLFGFQNRFGRIVLIRGNFNDLFLLRLFRRRTGVGFIHLFFLFHIFVAAHFYPTF